MPFLKSFEFGQKLDLTHNFGYRYARKSIKGSIDAEFHLVFNEALSQKNGSMGWSPGPDNVAKISQTCPHCDVTSRKPPTENKKRFFRFQLEDLLNP